MLLKIISGAQTGADIAGLIAAKVCGFPTGGCMPKGFRNQTGNHPEYAKLYNLIEDESWEYPPRTERNVKDSDGTLRFATEWNSTGERLTLRLIKKHNKPNFDVWTIGHTDELLIEKIKEWIVKNNIQVLNVAGNSEKTSPGIQRYVVNFMTKLLKGLKDEK